MLAPPSELWAWPMVVHRWLSEEAAKYNIITKQMQQQLNDSEIEMNDLREQLLLTSKKSEALTIQTNEKTKQLERQEMQRNTELERVKNEEAMSTMRMEAKESQIRALEIEIESTRRMAKSMESAAVMAQYEFMVRYTMYFFKFEKSIISLCAL